MSQHIAIALKPELRSVIVGWDSPMRTFFGYVYDLTIPEDSDESDQILGLGDKFDEIKDVKVLQAELAEFATLSPELIDQLNQDKQEAIATHQPSQLQQWMEKLMTGVVSTPTHTPKVCLPTTVIEGKSADKSIEVLKCRIDWWLGYGNSPALIIWVNQVPNFCNLPHQKFLLPQPKFGRAREYDRFLYYYESGGFVHKLHGNPAVNEGGFEGSAFNVMLEDGTTETVLGPWDSAWHSDLPVPCYRSVVLIEPSRSRWAGYVTETKLTELLEQFCPEAELVDNSDSMSKRKVIKRKGQELGCQHPGAVPHSEQEHQGFTIKCFWVPETGEAIAEAHQGEDFVRRSNHCKSPEEAIAQVQAKLKQLVAVTPLADNEEHDLF